MPPLPDDLIRPGSIMDDQDNKSELTTINDKSAQVEVAQLQVASASSIEREERLTSELNALKPTPIVEAPTCNFLKKIPLEIRNEIYGYLLVNDVLSQARSYGCDVSKSWRFNPFPFAEKYELSLSILRACRQILQEASQILYGRNKFIVDCGDNGFMHSPLFRKFTSQYIESPRYYCVRGKESLEKEPNIAKVKHWKIFVRVDEERSTSIWPQESFTAFCQTISVGSSQTLAVRIIAKGDGVTQLSLLRSRYMSVSQVLHPLQLFRRVPSLDISYAVEDDATISKSPPDMPLFRSHDISLSLKTELKTHVQGNIQDTHVFKMYKALLAYA